MNKKFLVSYLIFFLLFYGCSDKPISEKQKAINAYKEKQRKLHITNSQPEEIKDIDEDKIYPLLTEEEIPLTFYKRGVKYASQGKFEEAKEQFNKALEIYKFDEGSRESLNILKDMDKGIMDEDCVASIFKGENYNLNGNTQQAIAELQKVIQINPNLVHVYESLGAMYFYLREYQQAIPYCQKAIQIDPNNIRSYETLGLTHNALGQFQQAIAELHKAIKIDPNHATLYASLGYVYFSMGQTEQAIAEINKAIQINPYISDIYNTLGVIYHSLGDYQKAIDYSQKAIQVNPGDRVTCIALGVNYLYLEEPHKAIPYFQKAIQINPDLIEGYNGLGFAHFSLGQYKEAQEAFQRLKELSQSRGNYKMVKRAEEYLDKIRELVED